MWAGKMVWPGIKLDDENSQVEGENLHKCLYPKTHKVDMGTIECNTRFNG